MDIVADAADALRMLAELGLVGVALEQARGQRMPPGLVQQMRQDFDDLALGGGHEPDGEKSGKEDQ